MILYDFGCFNGDSVLHFAAYPEIDRIQAYDPNPTFDDLWEAISKRYPYATFTNAAVSNKNGKIEYNLRPESAPLGSTTNKDKVDFAMGEKIQAECIDVADIIEEDCWIKMDTEGEEYNILERLIETDQLKYVKKIFLEWHTSKLKADYRKREENILNELNRLNVSIEKW